MKKLLLTLILLGGTILANADEINIKFASYVKHHINYGFDWNEGWNNRAKGIEYIYDTNNKNSGIGITYLNFVNSFYTKVIAKGFVYRYKTPLTDDISLHSKLYLLHQKGYMRYQIYGASDNMYDDTFWTPMFSLGLNYKGFTIDGLHSKDALTALTFGYAWTF